MKIDMLKDIEQLTNIPRRLLDKQAQIAMLVIADSMKDNKNVGDILEINLGIGNLFIENRNEDILYKFFPTVKLQKAVIDVIKSDMKPLEGILEKKLGNKFLNTYKEIL